MSTGILEKVLPDVVGSSSLVREVEHHVLTVFGTNELNAVTGVGDRNTDLLLSTGTVVVEDLAENVHTAGHTDSAVVGKSLLGENVGTVEHHLVQIVLVDHMIVSRVLAGRFTKLANEESRVDVLVVGDTLQKLRGPFGAIGQLALEVVDGRVQIGHIGSFR